MNIKPSPSLPGNLHVDEKKHNMFEELTNEAPFKGMSAPMKGVFLYAMAIGWYNKQRIHLNKKKGSIPSDTITKPDERWSKERWLLNAIAIAETENINIILNGEEVAKIAEEYANGGIDYLYNMLKNPHTLDKKQYEILDKDLNKVIEKLKNEGAITLE